MATLRRVLAPDQVRVDKVKLALQARLPRLPRLGRVRCLRTARAVK